MEQRLSQLVYYLKEKISRTAYTQLLITLISLPILISWGLGFSLVSFISNIIFTPFLLVFLFFSSLLFFAEALGLPCTILVKTLEAITNWWHRLLQIGSPEWLCYFPSPYSWMYLCIPIIIFLIIKKTNTSAQGTLKWLFIIVSLTFFSLDCYKSYRARQPIVAEYNQGLVIQKVDGVLRLIDNGFLNRKKAVDKFLEFELNPYLSNLFGSTNIDELVLLRPAGGSFAAAKILCEKTELETVFVPYFEALTSGYAWALFFEFTRAAKKYDVILCRELPDDLPTSINRQTRI